MLPELISGWREKLMGDEIKTLLQEYVR